MDQQGKPRDAAATARQEGVARDLANIFGDRRAPRTTAIVRTVPPRRRRWISPLPAGLGLLALATASAGIAVFVGEVSPTPATITTPKLLPSRAALPQNAGPKNSDESVLVAVPQRKTVASSLLHLDTGAPDVRTAAVATDRMKPRVLPRLPDNLERNAVSEECDDLQDEERAWCMRPAILAAHRQLRATYDEARAAGVDSGELAGIQGHWTSLQRRAADRPEDTLEGYRDLRRHLLDLIEDARDDGGTW